MMKVMMMMIMMIMIMRCTNDDADFKCHSIRCTMDEYVSNRMSSYPIHKHSFSIEYNIIIFDTNDEGDDDDDDDDDDEMYE